MGKVVMLRMEVSPFAGLIQADFSPNGFDDVQNCFA